MLAAWKYALSFRKRDWELRDYPVWISEQTPDPGDPFPRWHLWRYAAKVVNWAGPDGCGDSLAEALSNLENNFQKVKARKPLPRPGTGLPIEFASSVRVAARAELADDFIRRILDVENAWISDESSLWDFHGELDNTALFAEIEDVYGVDVSDIQSGNLADIFDRIAAQEGKK